MRKLLFIFLMLLTVSISLCADNGTDQKDEQPPLKGAIISTSTQDVHPSVLRVPSNADVLIIIRENAIHININNDFGIGTYCLTLNNCTCEYYGNIDTSIEPGAIIPCNTSLVSNLAFEIEFEDGNWCHIDWKTE